MPSFTKENEIPLPEWKRIKLIRTQYREQRREYIKARETRNELIRELSIRWAPAEIARFLDTTSDVVKEAIKNVPSMR
jgi:hypothetical protein